jgi:hypothetical protein
MMYPKVPASKHAQAHLSFIPGLHESHNGPAVGWEHQADCTHGSAAIGCPELDLRGHVSAYRTGLGREDQSAAHKEQQLELHQLQAETPDIMIARRNTMLQMIQAQLPCSVWQGLVNQAKQHL